MAVGFAVSAAGLFTVNVTGMRNSSVRRPELFRPPNQNRPSSVFIYLLTPSLGVVTFDADLVACFPGFADWPASGYEDTTAELLPCAAEHTAKRAGFGRISISCLQSGMAVATMRQGLLVPDESCLPTCGI